MENLADLPTIPLMHAIRGGAHEHPLSTLYSNESKAFKQYVLTVCIFRCLCLAILVCALCVGWWIAFDSVMVQPHVGSEHVTIQQGKLTVSGDVTGVISRIWSVKAGSEQVSFVRLTGYNPTYKIADAAIGETLHKGQTVHLWYDAQQGSIENVSMVLVLG